MRERKPYVILTFYRTTDAMAMEKKCGQCHIPGRLIPVPGEIRAGCGLAWRIPVSEYEERKEAIKELGIPVEDIVTLEMR